MDLAKEAGECEFITKPEGAFPSCGGIWQEIFHVTLLKQCLVGRERKGKTAPHSARARIVTLFALSAAERGSRRSCVCRSQAWA